MLRSLLLIVPVLALVAGCGRLSFIGERFDNFSAYYNKFYNAELALDDCMEGFALSVEDTPVDQTIFISLFGRNPGGVTQRQPCEDAVLKSADVLRNHPNSKWVDDATLLIGKSWFFTQNFVGAEQKFNEILELDSPLRFEARFWLARTHIASGAYDAANDYLLATLASEDLPARWEPQYRLALAELHVTRENWEEAALELEAGVGGVRDRDLASRVQFMLGQVYEKLGRYEDAVLAYDEVQRHKPWYELSYAAHFSAIRVLAEYGDASLALPRLRKMERDDKNYEYRGQLTYLRARTYQRLSRHDEAFDLYSYLLYDRDGSDRSMRGSVHYALALYYRDVERNFQYAAAHFDTAQTALSGGNSGSSRRSRSAEVEGQPGPGAITDADEQVRIFSSFADVMDRIQDMDSLLHLGSLPDSTFDAWVLELRQQRAKEQEERRREDERRAREEGFRNSMGGFNQGVGALPPGKDVGQGNAGFLFHRDDIQMQQALVAFQSIWGDRPLARNWRRSAAVSTALAEDSDEEDEEDTEDEKVDEDQLPTVNVEAVPRDSASKALMQSDRALAWYELGNVLFMAMNKPDSAAFWYRSVIEEASTAPVAQRAYYALAEVQRALGDTVAAERLYREVLERFNGTRFAAQAAHRLGEEAQEVTETDSLVLAESYYAEHHAAWQAGSYPTALQGMMDAAQTYATTHVAPRALLAAGNIYLTWASRDSVDLFGPFPVTDSSAAWMRRSRKPPLSDTTDVKLKTVLDVIRSQYPSSKQAEPAANLIKALDQRWAELMAPVDSMRRVDSLATADSLYRIDSLLVLVTVDSLIALNDQWLTTADSLLTDVRDSLFVVIEDSVEAVKAATVEAARLQAQKLAQAKADSTAAEQPPKRLGVVQPSQLQPALSVQKEIEGVPNRLAAGGKAADPQKGLAQQQLQDPGLGVIDWSKGGYTIVVRTESQHAAAVAFATNYGRTLPEPVDIFAAASGGVVEFRIGAGLFPTISQAQQAMQRLAGQLPDGSEIVRIPGSQSF